MKHLQLCQAVSQLSDLSQLSCLTGLRHLDINFGTPGGPGCVTALPPSQASAAVFSILKVRCRVWAWVAAPKRAGEEGGGLLGWDHSCGRRLKLCGMWMFGLALRKVKAKPGLM